MNPPTKLAPGQFSLLRLLAAMFMASAGLATMSIYERYLPVEPAVKWSTLVFLVFPVGGICFSDLAGIYGIALGLAVSTPVFLILVFGFGM